MKRKMKISIQHVRFYTAAKDARGWSTTHDLAMKATIAERTARAFAKKFVLLGLFEVREVFPAYLYRLSKQASQSKAAYLEQLKQAREVFHDAAERG